MARTWVNDFAEAVTDVMSPGTPMQDKNKKKEEEQVAQQQQQQQQQAAAAAKAAEDARKEREARMASTAAAMTGSVVAGYAPKENDLVRQRLMDKAMYGTPNTQERERAREKQYSAVREAVDQYQTGGQQAETAKQQQDYAEMLRRRIEGKGKSAVQEQLKQALAQSQRQIASTIASQRGMNPMTAARLLAQEQSAQAQGIAGKAAEARLAEQMGLETQYGQVIGQTRTQDIEAASRQAQAVAQLTEALRSGDQAAINAAMQTLQSIRQGDIQLTEQERLARQATLQAQVDQARMAMEAELQRIRDEAAMDRLTQDQAYAAERDAKDRFYKLIAAIIGAAGGVGAAAAGAAKGGRIKGKALVRGDDEANDIVPALLSPGEIVIPRSIAQSKNAAERSKKFVAAIEKLEKKPKFSKKDASEKIAALEAELAALKSARSNKRQ